MEYQVPETWRAEVAVGAGVLTSWCLLPPGARSWACGSHLASRPRGEPGPQPHLGNIIVPLHNAPGVEILGADQAQPQAQQEQRHALQWVGARPACCPLPLSPSLCCGFRPQLFCILCTGLHLLGTRPKAAMATPVLRRQRLALAAAQMGAWLGLKSQREVGTGWCLGLKPRRPQRRVAPGPIGAFGCERQRTAPLPAQPAWVL